MSKELKKILSVILIICIQVGMIKSATFAYDLSSKEKKEITETFNEVKGALKDGDIITALMNINVQDADLFISDIGVDIIPYGSSGKKALKEIMDSIPEGIDSLAVLFREYDFDLKKISKAGVNEYDLVVRIKMPEDIFFENIKKSMEAMGKNGIFDYMMGVYNSTVGILGRTILDPRVRVSYMCIKAYGEESQNEYKKKQIERIIKVKKVEGRYVWNIVATYNLLRSDYKYLGKDNDEKNLFDYLFIPIWVLVKNKVFLND